MSYILIFLLTPKDIIDHTVVDTDYWRETSNRLLIKTEYNYNDKNNVESFPKTLGEWRSFDYRYPKFVYRDLNADILMSRGYTRNDKNVIWIDIINSKTGESFHKQKICVKGAGWTIDNEDIAEFKITDYQNPFTKFYANRLDVSKGDKKQIIVYWFMFKKFGSNNSVTMIRLSSPVRNNETNITFDRIRDFVENQLFDVMYESTKMEKTTVAGHLISRYGDKGLFVIIAISMIPIGIIIIGIRRKN